MIRSFVAPALAALALAGCGAGLSAPQPAGAAAPMAAPVAAAPAVPEDRLFAAIEAEGCVLNAENVSRVLQRADMTPGEWSFEEMQAWTERLEAEGRIEVAGEGSVRVLSPNC